MDGMLKGMGLPPSPFCMGFDLAKPGSDITVQTTIDQNGKVLDQAKVEGEEIMRTMIVNNELKGAVRAGDEELEG